MTEHRPEPAGSPTEREPGSSPPGSSSRGSNTARWWTLAAVVAVAVVVGVLVARGIGSSTDATADLGADGVAAAEPAATRLADGISLGTDGPIVEVYLDFFCESCAELETRVGDAMVEMVRGGEMTLVLRPVKFVSPFSSRSAAALSCTVGSGHTLAYQQAIFANLDGTMPTERLVGLATEVGVEDPGFEECVTARESAQFVNATTRAARDRGVVGVPAVFVDGEQVDTDITATPAEFRAALDRLAG